MAKELKLSKTEGNVFLKELPNKNVQAALRGIPSSAEYLFDKEKLQVHIRQASSLEYFWSTKAVEEWDLYTTYAASTGMWG